MHRLRPSLSVNRRLFVLIAPLAVGAAVLCGAIAYNLEQPAPTQPVDLGALSDLPPVPGLLVYVSGAVAHPGMYRLNRGDRLYAAIAAAGGLTAQVDPNRLPDLAQRLRDGQQVKVPIIGVSSSGSSTRITKVDLNSATADELAAIPGFTPALAQAAVGYRDGYGGFASTKELMTVLGMGQDQYLQAKAYIKV